MSFPNERPISQHDLIAAVDQGTIGEFSDELVNASYSETYEDFDFTEVPIPATQRAGIVIPSSTHIIARPRPGVQQKVWGCDRQGQGWFEDITVDAQGRMLDSSGQTVGTQAPGAAPPVGTCTSCGQSTALPNGGTAMHCPYCGVQQPAMQIPVISGSQLGAHLAGQLGQLGAAAGVPVIGAPNSSGPVGPPPNYNADRMTGSQKPPVVIPEGLGKASDKEGQDDFAAFLDQAIEAGGSETGVESDPTRSTDN